PFKCPFGGCRRQHALSGHRLPTLQRPLRRYGCALVAAAAVGYRLSHHLRAGGCRSLSSKNTGAFGCTAPAAHTKLQGALCHCTVNSGRRGTARMSSSDPFEAPLRLAILLSGSGSNLQALIDAIESKELPGVEIALVVSNNASAYGLQRALKHTLPTVYLPWRQRTADAQLIAPKKAEMSESETRITALLRLFRVDLIVLA